jgi:hypothetical protein
MVGPALFHTVSCADCSTHYNKKTGKTTTGDAVLYSVVAGAIAIVAFFLIYLSNGR